MNRRTSGVWVVTVRAVFVLSVIIVVASGCSSRCAESYPSAPSHIEAAGVTAASLRALDVHRLSAKGIDVVAVVFEGCSSDHRVVFYRADTGSRLGPEFNLLNSVRPHLVGSPARLVTANREPMMRMHFVVTPDDVDLVPGDGAWEVVKPSQPSTKSSEPTPD